MKGQDLNLSLCTESEVIVLKKLISFTALLWMEEFPAEGLHDIISILIHLQQYGNDLKWMWVTHCVHLQNVLDYWIKKLGFSHT